MRRPLQSVTYYLECPEMSDTEREQFWPWKSEQEELQSAFNNISTAVNDLVLSGANTTELVTTTDQLECSVTADKGLLGYQGPLSCANIADFIQGIVVQACTESYDPLHS